MSITAEGLKSAIESGNFEKALTLAEEFENSVRFDLSHASTLEKRLAIANEALEFLQDRLHLARVMRAHIASQLSTLSRLSCYGSSSVHNSTWTFEG